MRFGKYLEKALVSEWEDQYLDYDIGKKRIKQIAILLEELRRSQPTEETPLFISAKVKPIDSDSINLKRGSDISYEGSFQDAGEIPDVTSHNSRSSPDDILKPLRCLDGLSYKSVPSDKFEKGQIPNVSSNFFLSNLEQEKIDFMMWLESELRKIEAFYMTKEKAAYDKFLILEDQFLMLKEHSKSLGIPEDSTEESVSLLTLSKKNCPKKTFKSWNIVTYQSPRSYDNAKEVLKKALLEYYRKLALIQSYRTINRTAFRKITKKYDKVTGSFTSETFIKRIAKEAYFIQSNACDRFMSRVEDIFVKFYCDENFMKEHFLEELKMVTHTNKIPEIPSTYSGVTFCSGLFIGLSIPLLISGVIYGWVLTKSEYRSDVVTLLQIWGGLGLLNLCLLLIGITFVVYSHFRINYKFIFEFDLTSSLDYKEFFVLPSLGFLLFCLLFWLSFSGILAIIPPGAFPPIYVCCVLLIFLWPGSQLYPKSRKWLQILFWRIFCSGLYPVESRDFFLGNILCSLGYSLSNFSFFFCFYKTNWKRLWDNDPLISCEKCGPSYSRMMGFLAALPLIWRLLHCVRRYVDTGDIFPHLFNMTKYGISVCYIGVLSNWRIERTLTSRKALIIIASINSVSTSIWDIVMDWSLGQVRSRNLFLRDQLLYKKRIYYYLAISLDILLRFQWILFLICSSQPLTQAKTSFLVAFGELFRRFVWLLIRMENEHCANMAIYRASRNMTLPYETSENVTTAIRKLVDLKYKACETVAENVDPQEHDNVQEPDHEVFFGSGKEEHRIGLSPELENGEIERKSTVLKWLSSLKKAHRQEFERKNIGGSLADTEQEGGGG